MYQAKPAGEQIVDMNAAFLDAYFTPEKICNSGNEYGAGYEELNDGAAVGNNLERREGQCDGMTNGKCSNEDKHFSPILHRVHRAKSHYEKDVIVPVSKIEDMIFSD